MAHIAEHAHVPGLRGIWEARFMEGPLYAPIKACTQFPSSRCRAKPHTTLQQLIEEWAYEQDTGEVTALARPPEILSLQLMRFQGDLIKREVGKLEHSLPLTPKLQVPSFTGACADVLITAGKPKIGSDCTTARTTSSVGRGSAVRNSGVVPFQWLRGQQLR